MAIFTRWQGKVEIWARCGEHQPEDFVCPVRLVQVKREEGEVRYQFLEFLRADEGMNEIEAAYADCAREENLSDEALNRAIKQAM